MKTVDIRKIKSHVDKLWLCLELRGDRIVMKFITKIEFDIPGPIPDNWMDYDINDIDDIRQHSHITTDINDLQKSLIGHWMKVKSGELENALMGIILSIERE